MKYRLTDETLEVGTVILHRIECVEAFSDVKTGDKGGWIEKESNLSQENGAWVYDEAKVFGNAWVCNEAQVFEHAKVSGNAWVCEHAQVYGDAWIYGDARVFEYARVCDDANVSDNAWIYGGAGVFGYAEVFEDAKVCGTAVVRGYARIRGNAKISYTSDYIVFLNNFSSGRYFTWTKSDDMWTVGCFHGTGEQLIEKARRDDEVKAKCYALYVKLVEDLQKIE